jgi:nucleotide-binding universal stress UspA family protein
MYTRILLAVDGSEHSKKAVPAAADLAKCADGEIRVFHVREVEVGRAGVVPLETTTDAADLVNGVVHDLHAQGAKASGDARSAPYGRAAKDILDEATSFGADAIVMGSRGLSDFSALLVGSVAHKVIQHAECPVLVVR